MSWVVLFDIVGKNPPLQLTFFQLFPTFLYSGGCVFIQLFLLPHKLIMDVSLFFIFSLSISNSGNKLRLDEVFQGQNIKDLSSTCYML